MSDPIDENLLIERIGRQETAAEAELLAHFDEQITWLIRRHIGNSSHREDLRADIQLAVLQTLRKGGFDAGRGIALGAYIYGIAINKIRDFMRIMKRNPIALDHLAETLPAPETQSKHEYHQESTQLRSRIRRLPEKYQIVLFLKFYEGLSVSDIAVQLGIPSPTVSERLYYALKLLKQQF